MNANDIRPALLAACWRWALCIAAGVFIATLIMGALFFVGITQ